MGYYMNNTTTDHEKLFDEICSKLHELSGRPDMTLKSSDLDEQVHDDPSKSKYEKIQDQMQKFQNDLLESHV